MSNDNQNLWTLQNFGRVDLYVDEFDRAIYQKGARVLWEKSSLCSCLNSTTGQAEYDCPACGGKGYVYFDPTPIRAVVSGIRGDNNQIPIGLMDVGTSYMTTMSKDVVGFRDRVTFVDFESVYSQILEFNPEGTKLKYPAMSLVSVRVLNDAIPPEYIELSEDKQTLIISEEYGLTYGERFSILYSIQPRYIVVDIPHELRGTFVKFGNPDEKWTILPRQFMIKREDLLPLQRGELI